MKRLLLALCLACAPLSSPACLNSYFPNQKARLLSASIYHSIVDENLAEPWPARQQRLERAMTGTASLEIRNDLAVALLHNHETARAITLLEAIEREHPGLYPTATNLGTAYELAGRDQEALWWIEEGIRRNPESHGGSEWIHAALLRKKVEFAAQGTPRELVSIIGLTAPERLMPPGNNGRRQTRAQVIEGLKHQLHERLPFVRPPDYYVASLLYDLARLYEAETGAPNVGFYLNHLALTYGSEVNDRPFMDELYLANLRSHAQRSALHGIAASAPVALATWLLLSLAGGLVRIFWKRENGRAAWCRLLFSFVAGAALVVPIWLALGLSNEGFGIKADTSVVLLLCVLSVLLASIVYRHLVRRLLRPNEAPPVAALLSQKAEAKPPVLTEV